MSLKAETLETLKHFYSLTNKKNIFKLSIVKKTEVNHFSHAVNVHSNNWDVTIYLYFSQSN